jgi:hypothetical protein
VAVIYAAMDVDSYSPHSKSKATISGGLDLLLQQTRERASLFSTNNPELGKVKKIRLRPEELRANNPKPAFVASRIATRSMAQTLFRCASLRPILIRSYNGCRK